MERRANRAFLDGGGDRIGPPVSEPISSRDHAADDRGRVLVVPRTRQPTRRRVLPEDRPTSGRHRKPSTPSIGVAKIAVTGAVIGGGSLGLADGAPGCDGFGWDTVASCESSGNWAINTPATAIRAVCSSPRAPGWATAAGVRVGGQSGHPRAADRDRRKGAGRSGQGAWPVCGRGPSGPTPREVTTIEVTYTEAPAAPADTPVDAPAPAAAQDVPVIPEELPVPALPMCPRRPTPHRPCRICPHRPLRCAGTG